MLFEIIRDAWSALLRNRTRSTLTMLGIVWGIVAVTMLNAYGGGFRTVLVSAFNAFGKSAVIVWPGQTSEQAGGQRAGKHVRIEQVDIDRVRQLPIIKHACGETVRQRNVQAGDLFWALPGARFDGHDFLDEAARRGAVACVAQDGKPVPSGMPRVRVQAARA